jgi:hypothetical protein
MKGWRIAAAAAGLALAVLAAPLLQGPAPAHALPGAMAARGLDARGPLWQFALALLLPFVFALFVRGRSPSRARGRFTRAEEAILLPVCLSLAFALLDFFPRLPFGYCLAAATAVVVILRLAIARFTAMRRPALAFALAPLALLAQMQWMPVSRAAVLAALWIVVTPLLLAMLQPPERVLRRVVSLVVFPIVVFTYPLTLLGIRSTPQVDFFEDEHQLVPGSEMLRGELPYRDVVPVHALLTDGGIDLLAMKAGDDTIGELLSTRRVVSALNLVAIYAVGYAATGSAGLGLIGVFVGISLFPAAAIWLRTIPALFALAAACSAVRLRSIRRLRLAGGLLVLAFLMGMEFAVYSGIVTLVVALRLRPRLKALTELAIGGAVIGIPIAALFAAFGFLDPFVRVTMGELLPAGKVYVPGPLTIPQTLSAALWALALVSTAAGLRGRKSADSWIRRADSVWLIGLWIAVAGLSYAQRRHAYYEFAIGVFLVCVMAFVSRRSRIAAAVVAVLILVLARPDRHLLQLAAPLRLAHGVPEGDGVRIDSLPRARGAVFRPEVAKAVGSAQKFTASLQPGETYYDFSNSGLLYFLLQRNAPTRHQHIPFIEKKELEGEVAERLLVDRSIAAVLIACPGGSADIDGVPNRVRAPLVWQAIERHFVPSFEENGVVFWRRR